MTAVLMIRLMIVVTVTALALITVIAYFIPAANLRRRMRLHERQQKLNESRLKFLEDHITELNPTDKVVRLTPEISKLQSRVTDLEHNKADQDSMVKAQSAIASQSVQIGAAQGEVRELRRAVIDQGKVIEGTALSLSSRIDDLCEHVDATLPS